MSWARTVRSAGFHACGFGIGPLGTSLAVLAGATPDGRRLAEHGGGSRVGHLAVSDLELAKREAAEIGQLPAGRAEGGRIFAEEFAEWLRPAHGSCGADCWCRSTPDEAEACLAQRSRGRLSSRRSLPKCRTADRRGLPVPLAAIPFPITGTVIR